VEEFPMSKTINIQSGHAIPATAPKELTKTIFDFLK
jgi:hypothetical protein